VSESQPADYVLIILTGDAIIFRFDYETFVLRPKPSHYRDKPAMLIPIADPEATLNDRNARPTAGQRLVSDQRSGV
jgi:hypothetical protein